MSRYRVVESDSEEESAAPQGRGLANPIYRPPGRAVSTTLEQRGGSVSVVMSPVSSQETSQLLGLNTVRTLLRRLRSALNAPLAQPLVLFTGALLVLLTAIATVTVAVLTTRRSTASEHPSPGAGRPVRREQSLQESGPNGRTANYDSCSVLPNLPDESLLPSRGQSSCPDWVPLQATGGFVLKSLD